MSALDVRLATALANQPGDLPRICSSTPTDRSVRFRVLITIYRALNGPVSTNGGPQARVVTHPAISALKWRLENQWLDELSERSGVVDSVPESHATEGMRALSSIDTLDSVYRWIASHSTSEQLLSFLAADGLADDRLEDLFAATLVGLEGSAKMGLATELAHEIGAPAHIEAYSVARASLGIERAVDLVELSEASLERIALPGLMMSNHWLQPEAIGFLSMRALQSSARASRIVHALKRHRASAEALEFYRDRAALDASAWLSDVVRPAAKSHPDWSHRIIRGARWRLATTEAFVTELHSQLRRGAAAPARKAA